MDIFNQGYDSPKALQNALAPQPLGRFERPSITDRLADRKAHLEAELEQVNAALAKLEQNPEVQAVIDQLAKLNF